MNSDTRAVLDAATPRPWSNVAAVPQEFVGDADLREMKADYALAELAVNSYEAREQLIDSLSAALEKIENLAGTIPNGHESDYCRRQRLDLMEMTRAALRLARERDK